MGVCRIFSIVLALVVVIISWMVFNVANDVPEMPHIDQDVWWGPGERPKIIEFVGEIHQSFKIPIDTEDILQLKYRLKKLNKLTPSLNNSFSEHGVNSEFLRAVLKHWRTKYNFEVRLNLLNNFDHYKTKIQGLNIHYITVKPTVSRKDITVLPILLLHGWPSSSAEFVEVTRFLTVDRGNSFVFHVVAADLPGFGFSEGTTKKGLNPAQMAVIMKNLMTTLEFPKFYIHGGDWGSQIASHMATMYPDDILGYHTTMAFSSTSYSLIKFIFWYMFPFMFGDAEHVSRMYPLSNYTRYLYRESGYFHLQATKPDTIGVALSDSPAGLAAYIIGVVSMCTKRDQLHTYHGGMQGIPLDNVLDMITIAWFSNSITTSMRLYAEGMNKTNEISILQRIPTKVPTAILNNRYEVIYQPNCVLKDKYTNIVHTTTLDHGGHYSALQAPKVLGEDIIEATKEFLKFHKSQQIL